VDVAGARRSGRPLAEFNLGEPRADAVTALRVADRIDTGEPPAACFDS
jgi:hypothetical protein